MLKKNGLIILIVILLIAAVAVAATLIPNRVDTLPEGLVATDTPAPAPDTTDAANDASPAVEPTATAVPARGYVWVSAANQGLWLPLMDQEYSYPITLNWDDGTQSVNTLRLTTDGVYMESSTCDNQDCVNQGIVTLDNKDERVLMNFIVCLPNQVSVELFTPEELLEMMAQAQEAAQ